MIPSIAITNFPDKVLQKFSDDTRALQRFLAAVPFVDGKLVTLTALAAPGTIDVNHGLGALPRGFLVLDVARPNGSTTAISIFRRSGDQLDTKVMRLYSTATFDSLKLWVF